MIPMQIRIVFFLITLVFLSSNCSSVEKKEVQIPFLGEKRADLPILIQFEEEQEYNAKSLMATFFTGQEGKEQRVDREYAKFPILVGTGARSKELELEGTVTKRESAMRSEVKEVYIHINGSTLSHNCGLGVLDSFSSSKSGLKAFRSVKILFRGTGDKDVPRTGVSWALGLVTYFLYPLIATGFYVEKMECGLVLEG
ncbi:hypothetical protein EHQ27_18775 [Leptospira wolffii]|uniref:hypothetical protein n=1 Tax=Leptospira wolffii TaxID=409998 RepID=UPI001083E49A|nr:hypothetical protein [Leptospira wolffii]TGK62597.1 hypothetical protein EHQ32_07215 [Leptospira wolffii]TGK65572.1 hypothetical protein EHQ27_18775 [Leptospira wolffii]TGK74017.1 hypothetical protein EHQ35_06550 [Leptospira wolffii]TGL28877.1 hypothetical protein EHQ57_13075 [Leptospira wolffii]